jgi:HK97 family phage major capsid protein
MSNEFSEILALRADMDPKLKRLKELASSDNETELREFEQLKDEIEKMGEKEERLLIAGGLSREDIFGESVALRGLEGINLITGEYSAATKRTNPGGAEYRSMWGAPKDSGGFNSFNDYLTAISGRQMDPRLKEMRFMNTEVPSEGGFIVPEQWAQEILDRSLEQEIVRPRARNWPMETETLNIPVWDSFDHSGGDLYGGLSGQWLAEGGAAVNEDPLLRSLKLDAKKLAIYCQASREMVQSGISFEQQLSGVMFKAVSWHLDSAFITGVGAGRPLGILNSPGVVEVAPEGGQHADTILHENLSKMFARLHPALIQNSVWLANSSIIPQLLHLSIVVGVGGVHVPVLSDTGGQFKMLTRPVIFTEKVPALGNRGDLVLVDLSQYSVGMKQQIIMDKSNAPGWTNDLESYRVIVRADGQGSWPSEFTPANGDSQGWAVVLGDR